LNELRKNLPIKQFVLAIIIKQEKILLGYKKTGLGKGKWNGFGGKVEEFDSSLEEAMKREVKEEAQIDITEYYRAAHLVFQIDTIDYLLDVTVYYCGDLREPPVKLRKWFQNGSIWHKSPINRCGKTILIGCL